MNEIPIIWKLIVTLIILGMFVVSAFLGWRVLRLMDKVKLLRADRNELLEERAKQSNKLRLKGIEMDEANKDKIVLSEIEKKMILAALNMPEYGKAILDPKTSFQVRKTYRDLKEKIKESFG